MYIYIADYSRAFTWLMLFVYYIRSTQSRVNKPLNLPMQCVPIPSIFKPGITIITQHILLRSGKPNTKPNNIQ